MSLWRQLTRGLRVLVNRSAADQDVDDEVRHYLDETTKAWVARGLSPEDARRAARLELGSPAAVRDEVRATGWEHLAGTFAADLRYAARRLLRAPGFAVVSTITLALGIGASTAIFSAVKPILFEALPYPQPGQLMMLWYAGQDAKPTPQAFGTFREIIARSRAFSAMAVMKPWQPTITGPAEPERIDGQRVSADYFRVFAVPPAIGQSFDAADDHPGGQNVVVLGDALWRRRFQGDPAIVGRQITLNDTPYTVVGVMPRGFENVLEPTAEIWSLLQYDPALPTDGREWGHHLRMMGRLAPDATPALAKRELDEIARAPLPELPRPAYASMQYGLIANALQADVARGVKSALLAVIGAVLLVLAIACVDVTNLLLARGAQRRPEFALRLTLGAGRARLIRQVITESLLVAVIGGALGVVVAQLGIRTLVALSPAELPRLSAISVDGTVLAFALTVSTIVGIAMGLIPALFASRDDLSTGLRHASRRTAGGHQSTRRLLVIAEVAIALVLLVAAGLLFRSLERLFAISPGFDASRVLTMQVQVSSGRRYADPAALRKFFAAGLEAVKHVRGVERAVWTSELPLTDDSEIYAVRFQPGANDRPDPAPAFRYAVTPGYFEAMGIPLHRGRLFDERDMSPVPERPVLINESLATHTFGDQDPIGRRLRFGGPADRPWDVIVGVVGDVKQTSLAAEQANAVYVVTDQWIWADNPLWLVVKATGDAAGLTPALKQAIWAVDKDQPIVRVATMEHLLAASAAQRRFALILFETFGLVALVLTAIGIYGVLSSGVAERMREIGIRAALGASRADILGVIVGQGITLTVGGVVIGLVAALVASRALETLLFGVSRLDPITYLGVVALLLGVASVACCAPAWRAARIDPSITLRIE